MAKAVRVYKPGGPEVFEVRDVPAVALTRGLPPDEVKIRHEAIGVNYSDILHLRGQCRAECWFPFTPGFEAAGVVVECGANVRDFKVGDRVAYVSGQRLGSYCTERTLPTDALVHLPDDVSFETAAAGLFKGIVAWTLLNDCCPVKEGEMILVHAAAGGIGSLLCQLARAKGAYVIGTLSSMEKKAFAKENGCHVSVIYTQEDFVPPVMYATVGKGVHAVFDGVGGPVSQQSLFCTRRGGKWVTYGMSSGEAVSVAKRDLIARGIQEIVVNLPDITLRTDAYKATAKIVLEMLRRGELRPRIGQRYDLVHARKALEDLAERRTCGSIILIPPPMMPSLFDAEIMEEHDSGTA